MFGDNKKVWLLGGLIPLHNACSFGHAEVVSLLLRWDILFTILIIILHMHFIPCPHVLIIIITINHHYLITITFLLIMIIFLISVVIFLSKGRRRPKRERQLELHTASWGFHQGQKRCLCDASPGFSSSIYTLQLLLFGNCWSQYINTARRGPKPAKHWAENGAGRGGPFDQAGPHRHRLQEGRLVGGGKKVNYQILVQ